MMSSTRIQIPNELFAPAESSCFTGTMDLPFLKAGPDLYEFSGPLSWQASVSNTGDALLVTGTVEGSARTACARCLEDFSFPVIGEVEGYFLISSDSAIPEDMDEDEFGLLPEDNAIDLEPLIRAALLLELPLIPLCRDDCSGLCPACGQNLNEGACGCVREGSGPEKENPFAALKDFKFKDGA